MTRARFEPIGELARWRVLVDRYAETPHGELLTYAALGEALDLDPEADRKAIRAAVRQAGIILLRDHSRSLVAVRGEGYRIAQPDEHVDLASRQQRRSGRALARASAQVEHVDLSALSDEGRSIVHAAVSALAWQQQQIRRLDLRQRDLEQVVDTITTKVERTDEELAAMRGQIERIAARLPPET